MRTGEVTQTVWRRSVAGQICRTDGNFPPAIEERCGGFLTGKGGACDPCDPCDPAGAFPEPGRCVLASASGVGDTALAALLAVAEASNSLRAKGADQRGVVLSFDLPQRLEETDFSGILKEAARVSEEHGIPVLNVQAQTVPSLPHMLVHATAAGCVLGVQDVQPSHFPERELIVSGGVGFGGSLQILSEREDELRRRYRQDFLDGLRRRQESLFAGGAILTARECRAGIWQCGPGGILAALWNMGETLGAGMAVDLKRLPIFQETVELCETYGVNPYALTSPGTMLFAAPPGTDLLERLRADGYTAESVGRTEKGRERILFNGGDRRYLDRPAADELWKALKIKQ